jgi:hypothetical protein
VDPGAHAAALGYPGNVDIATAESMGDLVTPISPVRSEGNVSNQRTINGKAALVHTAAISRGNSGGPLVDNCGRVLGVNTYITNTASGDSPFGFAIVSQELMSFLRERDESFQQIGTPCVTMTQVAQREQQDRDQTAREQAAAEERAQKEQDREAELAKAKAEDSRENHAVGAALLVLFALVAAAFATVLFVKERTKAAWVSAAVVVVALGGSAYAFFTRPGLATKLPTLTAPVEAASAPVTGRLLCQVRPDVSRITVSTTDDLAMNWDGSGCMNGRTQYVREGERWRRVLVPNGSETVYVQDFDPAKGEYVSTRYLLPASDMERLREIRGEAAEKSCSSDPAVTDDLRDVTDHLVHTLPSMPNEKLVYHCSDER